MEKRYLQLYSIKDEVFKDFVGSLKRVAALGYTGVEFFGGVYGDLKAPELKKILADLNLEALSSHIKSDNVPEQLDYAIELGIKYMIDPMQKIKTYDDAMNFAQVLNEAGKKCADRGLPFGYHNHDHEFVPNGGGKEGTLMDTLILNTDPKLVCYQLDVGWASYAKQDPVAFIKKYAGRFKMIHVKECNINADGNWNVPAGTGTVDWPAVKDAALAQGAEAFIIEREHDYAGDIFKCVEEDCAFLKSL